MTGTMSTLGFFSLILSVYYILPLRFRWALLLAGSAIFYASADWKMIFLIVGSIGISYVAGRKIDAAEEKKEKSIWMIMCIVLLVIVLGFFKYFGFFAEAVNGLLKSIGFGSESKVLQLVMPLGISYYTFKIISYLVDIYKEKIEAEKHFGYYEGNIYIITEPYR